VTGGTAGNVRPGADINKISYMVGPRYTNTIWRKTGFGPDASGSDKRLQLYVQGLFGGARGFSGIYPFSDGVKTNANSFAIQADGGANYYLTRKFGVRLIEVDLAHTEFPNALSGTQNDLRLSFGATCHFGRR
jgi:hypothetical protein